MMATIVSIAGKVALSVLARLATEEVFEKLLIMLAEYAASSSKTKWDDKLVVTLKDALGKGK
jgi:hypothetical protein